MTIVYEVNLEIDREVAEAFRGWLRPHIDEMLTIDGFVGARWYERDGVGGATRVHWTVHYELEDQASLDAYVAEHADRMRGDGLDSFGGRFTASRRVLRLAARFTRAGVTD